MNKIEIDIDMYITEEEKKDLCKEYVREILRSENNANHIERVLNNMAYKAAYKILDDCLSPEMMKTIKEKAMKAIQESTDFCMFRKKDAWGEENSPAYTEVINAINEHKHLINPLVKKAILEKDYIKDLPKTSDYIGDVLIDALIKGFKGE